jgi:hypothetical protein
MTNIYIKVLYNIQMPNKKTQRVGSRAKVMHGGAEMTAGGLKKDDLMYNGKGRIVSKKKHHTMRQKMD